MKVCLYFCNMNKILLEVAGLSYSHSQSGAYALFLRKKNEKNCLPIIIGEAEAQSIAVALEGYSNKRPHTHDLFKTFAETYGIEIKEVVINKFNNGLYFSELHCVKDGEESILDSRPSDAVAIAIRLNIPIYAESNVMEEASVFLDDDDFVEEDIESQEISASEKKEVDYYDIADLETFLQNAIDDEDYIKASKLRDIINERKGLKK